VVEICGCLFGKPVVQARVKDSNPKGGNEYG